MASNKFALVEHEADFCVVGGGLAGLCAAVAAARHGAKVVLMQERPMLGGNASSEIRMWVSGAHGKNNRETGIIEELSLENHYRNPDKNYSLWDGVMYELAAYTPHHAFAQLHLRRLPDGGQPRGFRFRLADDHAAQAYGAGQTLRGLFGR